MLLLRRSGLPRDRVAHAIGRFRVRTATPAASISHCSRSERPHLGDYRSAHPGQSSALATFKSAGKSLVGDLIWSFIADSITYPTYKKLFEDPL